MCRVTLIALLAAVACSPQDWNQWRSPILHDAYLYGFSATQQGHGGQHASLISTGDLLVGLTTEAELSVMKRSPDKHHLVARYKVAESGVWAHLTPVNGGLLVKDATSLLLRKFASAKSASGKSASGKSK